MTSSLLHHSGLKEWIAYDEEDYIQKAVDACNNIDKLANLKHTIRLKFLNGKVSDHVGFTRDFEQLMLNTYHNHFGK